MAEKTSPPNAGPSADRRPPSGSPASAIVLGGLGVTVLAALAVFVSYNGMYQIARQGNISAEMAHLYPAIFTLLLVMAFWTTYVLRAAPPAQRIWVDVLVVGLIGLAAAATSLHLLDRVVLPEVAAVLVAIAPWAALLMAFRLWLWVIGHLRDGRARRPRAAVRAPKRAKPPADDTAPTAPQEPVGEPRHARAAPDTAPVESAPLVPGFSGPGPVAADAPLSAESPRSEVSGDSWFRSDDSEDATVRVLDRGEVAHLAEAGMDDGPDHEAAEPDTGPVPAPGPPAAARADEEPADERDDAPEAHKPSHEPSEGPEAPEERPEAPLVPTAREEPSGPAVPDDRPAAAEAAAPAEDRDIAAAAAAASDTPVLPKRTPTGNPIKLASANPATPDPGGDAEDDGFVGDLLADDPTSDEAHPLVPVGPAFDAAAPEPAAPPASRLHKQPMVLKPRRGTAPGVPTEPPSLRVRSGPIPPEG